MSMLVDCDCPYCGEDLDDFIENQWIKGFYPQRATKLIHIFCPHCGEKISLATMIQVKAIKVKQEGE